MAQKYILESQIPNLGGGGDEPKIPNNEIWYTSTNGNVVKPNATDGFGATIVSNTYSNGKGIIKFAGDVTSIAGNAFFGCTGLTSITIPNSVTSIAGGAFYVCSGLTAITIPDSVTSIGNGAFSCCTGLTSITIPDSVTSIGEYAFYNTPWFDNQPNGEVYINTILYKYNGDMPADSNIVVREGTTSIAGNAFSGCTGLTSITIPNSVTSIGNYAFADCTGLTSITIPNSVTSIGSYVFDGCKGLTAITIPDSVKSIGKYAFNGCTGITSITIGNGVMLSDTHVRYIGDGVFECCPNLKTVIVGSDEDAEIIFKKIPQNNITFDIVTLVNVDENGVIVKDKIY